MPVDYARPLDGKPFARPDVAALYLQACRTGDRPACWIAMELAGHDEEIRKLVEASCVAGDLLSCRALPDAGSERAPGAIARREECQSGAGQGSCSVEGLRAECLQGFPHACLALAEMSPSPPDGDALKVQAAELAAVGCAARIMDECEIARMIGPDDQRLTARQTACSFQGTCYGLAQAALRAGDRTAARDLLERSCQYGNDLMACSDLGVAYLSGKLEEPVPGRGKALAEWACAKIQKIRIHDNKIEACLATKHN
ncbi:MAG: hypothetical protein ABI467_05550 [Kofleriaceae bacterium]